MSYDRSKSKHQCAVPGCGISIPSSLLMCADHWRMVPPRLQWRVYHYYRNGASQMYLEARAAAIQSVTGGQP